MTLDRDVEPGPDDAIETRLAAAGLPPLPRRSWLEIDLDGLAANAGRLRTLLPARTALGVVVKADGYGHGLEMAAGAAIAGGARLLVVATLDEGLLLRDAGITDPILVIYPVPPAELGRAIDARLDLVVADDASVAAMAGHLASRAGGGGLAAIADGDAAAHVHLGIDTGMGRGGLRPERAADAAGRLLAAGLSALAGTWSHLAAPDDAGSVGAQAGRFEAALAELAAAGIDPGLRHLNATGGVVTGTSPAYDLVRVGLAFYGVLPPEVEVADALAAHAAALRPALALHARTTLLSTIEAGDRVGYAGTWTAPRRSAIATIALGYADGWVRAYAPGSWAVVRGRRVPVIGRISSDALALDVTDVAGFDIDDPITLIGAGGGAMTVHDLAAIRDSISWEVLDALAPRLSRVYLRGGRPVAVRYADGRVRRAGTTTGDVQRAGTATGDVQRAGR
jgi:alanine racemase